MSEITCFSDAVALGAGAMSYLVRAEICLVHAGEELSEEGVKAATKDAAMSFHWLYEMGHSSVISGVMEGIECSSWWGSPDEDHDAHMRLVGETFKKVMKASHALDEDAEEEEEIEDSPELTATKADLEKLFTL